MTKQMQGGAAPSNAGAKNPVLEVKDLCVSYGKVEALTDASLTVGEGQIVTVIGPNGAGKTTMLSAIMGVLGSRGQVAFDGRVEGVPEVERMVARGMTLVPEKRELFGEMSVEDNLVLGAFQRYRMGLRDHAQTMEEIFTLFPRLRERRTQMAGTLSGGQQQMVALARALVNDNKVLLVDEPTKGLAPLIVEQVTDALREASATVPILLVEQNLPLVRRIADTVVVLDAGKVVHTGSAADS